MSTYNTDLQTNNTSLEEILNTINNLPEESNGVDTSDATATANDILSGKTAYVKDEKITGTIATKTSSNLTASGATVTVPAGYYASNASKSVGTATQATPSVTVNSSGLITATATQSAGYVSAGSKSGTKQLTTQAAKTVTPSTSNQTAVASGRYTTGAITVKGDSNLKAENIKNGVSIFGVTGTHSGGGSSGESTDIEDSIITRTITTYTNDRITTIGSGAFYRCSNLTSVNFPKCTSIGSEAFYRCSKLTSVNFPVCIRIEDSAFHLCHSLTSVNFPKCTSIGSFAFYGCSKLTSVNFPKCSIVGNHAFNRCTSLTTIYLGASSICKLEGSTAFVNTGIWSNRGYIYVPSSLYSTYKTATNWVFFSKRIFSYTF